MMLIFIVGRLIDKIQNKSDNTTYVGKKLAKSLHFVPPILGILYMLIFWTMYLLSPGHLAEYACQGPSICMISNTTWIPQILELGNHFSRFSRNKY